MYINAACTSVCIHNQNEIKRSKQEMKEDQDIKIVSISKKLKNHFISCLHYNITIELMVRAAINHF